MLAEPVRFDDLARSGPGRHVDQAAPLAADRGKAVLAAPRDVVLRTAERTRDMLDRHLRHSIHPNAFSFFSIVPLVYHAGLCLGK
jgi:hypothetical protein